MLSRDDRLKVARMTGTALRLCGAEAADALGEPLHVQLDAGGGELVDRAVAVIHGISSDQVVLSQAAAMFTLPPTTPMRCYALRLLVAAGADEDEARRIQASRGKGWSTPQAEPWTPN